MVDGDLADGDLGYYLGVKNPSPTLNDFLLKKVDSIEEVKRNVFEQVDLIPSGKSLSDFLKLDISKFVDFISEYSSDYDMVLIDTPPGINRNSIVPMRASNQVLAVTTADEASVTGAENTVKVANLLEREVKGVVINKWRSRSFFSSLFGEDTQMKENEVKARMGVDILEKIPEDDDVVESTEVGEAIVRDKGGSVFDALERLASKL